MSTKFQIVENATYLSVHDAVPGICNGEVWAYGDNDDFVTYRDGDMCKWIDGEWVPCQSLVRAHDLWRPVQLTLEDRAKLSFSNEQIRREIDNNGCTLDMLVKKIAPQDIFERHHTTKPERPLQQYDGVPTQPARELKMLAEHRGVDIPWKSHSSNRFEWVKKQMADNRNVEYIFINKNGTAYLYKKDGVLIYSEVKSVHDQKWCESSLSKKGLDHDAFKDGYWFKIRGDALPQMVYNLKGKTDNDGMVVQYTDGIWEIYRNSYVGSAPKNYRSRDELIRCDINYGEILELWYELK